MNAALCERAYDSGALPFLVSPVTGAGIAVPRLAQLFLLAQMRGLTQAQQWAEFAGAALNRTGADSLASQDAAAALQPSLSDAQLRDKATQFAEVYLPVLRTLGVVIQPIPSR
jgi:hypothetical protein